MLKRSMHAPQVSQCTLQTIGHQSDVVVVGQGQDVDAI